MPADQSSNRMRRRAVLSTRCGGLALALFLVLAADVWAGPRIHRQGFDEVEPLLKLILTDGKVELLEHAILEDAEAAHDGRAEFLRVRVTSGGFCHVEYALPPTLISEELSLSAWAFADRPGTRMYARVVLPREIDPATGEPRTTLLPGDVYDTHHRQRRLIVRRPDELLQQQKQLLQAEWQRDVDIVGAYIDALVFDVYSGIGDVGVWIDDIEAGPLVSPPMGADEPAKMRLPLTVRDEQGRVPDTHVPEIASAHDLARARIVGERLHVGDRPFFLRAVSWSGTPVAAMKEAMFNSLVVPAETDEATAGQLAATGLHLVPRLDLGGGSAAPDGMQFAGSSRLDLNDAALLRGSTGYLFPLLSGGLTPQRQPEALSLLERLHGRAADRGAPVAANVAAGYRSYSGDFPILLTSRDPLGSATPLVEYQRWLLQRKHLGHPGTFYWSSVPTDAPSEYRHLVYGEEIARGSTSAVDLAIGPQPTQIDLVSYSVLAAGFRGLLYSSDRALTEAEGGRAKYLKVALLNLQLTLIEPFLVESGMPLPLKTSHPNVAAVAFRHERGTLVMLYWHEANSQYVVGQAAANGVQVLVENAPESAHAFQVTPGAVVGLKRRKDLGGIRLTVPEFDTAAFVVLTTQLSLYGKYRELVQQLAPRAAAWQQELAAAELETTETVHARLQSVEASPGETWTLLAKAREELDRSRAALEKLDTRQAYVCGQRSLRFTRAAQALHWQTARGGIEQPTFDPFLVSFYTLPEHYRFRQIARDAALTARELPAGDFEREGRLDELGWSYDGQHDPGLSAAALLVADEGPSGDGQRALELRVEATESFPSAVTENTEVRMVSPAVPVRAGELVRVTGFVRLPEPVQGSIDGAMVWDSLGGKSLALKFFRHVSSTGAEAAGPGESSGAWRPFVFYRPVREDGTLRVHLALTGVGAVRFDDIKVEVGQGAGAMGLPLAGRPTATRTQ